MSKETKTLLKASGIAVVIALAVVWASNNVDAVDDLIG